MKMKNTVNQRNHRGDTIKMDTAGADDVGDPRRRPRRDRLHNRTTESSFNNETNTAQQNEKHSYENETQHPQ